jgi:hypothetical protein
MSVLATIIPSTEAPFPLTPEMVEAGMMPILRVIDASDDAVDKAQARATEVFCAMWGVRPREYILHRNPTEDDSKRWKAWARASNQQYFSYQRSLTLWPLRWRLARLLGSLISYSLHWEDWLEGRSKYYAQQGDR